MPCDRVFVYSRELYVFSKVTIKIHGRKTNGTPETHGRSFRKERMKKTTPVPEIPTILVVLGATGDLITKKIIPAVGHLYVNKRLPSRFRVVGMARWEINGNRIIGASNIEI